MISLDVQHLNASLTSSLAHSEREKAQEKMFIEKREKDKLKEAKAKLEAAKKEVVSQPVCYSGTSPLEPAKEVLQKLV